MGEEMSSVEEILSEIPKQYHNSRLKYKDVELTLAEFIEHYLVPTNPNVSTSVMVDRIKNRYLKILNPDEKYTKIVNYIKERKENGTFVNSINNNFNVEEYMLTTMYEHMDNNGNITLAGTTKSLDEWYSTITTNSNITYDEKDVRELVTDIISKYLDSDMFMEEVLLSQVTSKYNFGCTVLQKCIDSSISATEVSIDGIELSIEDYIVNEYKRQFALLDQKIQECQLFLRGVPEELLLSKMNGVDSTLLDYIISVIPIKMTNDRKVVYNNVEYNAKDYVRKIVDDQKAYLESIDNEINRAYEKPEILDEIVIDAANHEITTQLTIPVNDGEIESLQKPSQVLNNSREYEFRKNISLIESAIYNSHSEKDLEGKVNQLRDIESRAKMMGLSPLVNAMIAHCWDLAEAKEQELVKVAHNKVDLAECVEDALIGINSDIKHTEDMTELAISNYKLNKFMEQFCNGNIVEFTIKDKVKNTINNVNRRSLVVSLSQDDSLVKNRSIESEIEYYIMQYKNSLLAKEYESDVKYQTAYEITLQKEKEDLDQLLTSALNSGKIDENKFHQYSEEIARLSYKKNGMGKAA